MSQSDIFELLKSKRLSGDSSYYSVNEIHKLLRERGINIARDNLYNHVAKLRLFGYLDTKLRSDKSSRARFLCSVYRLRRERIE